MGFVILTEGKDLAPPNDASASTPWYTSAGVRFCTVE